MKKMLFALMLPIFALANVDVVNVKNIKYEESDLKKIELSIKERLSEDTKEISDALAEMLNLQLGEKVEKKFIETKLENLFNTMIESINLKLEKIVFLDEKEGVSIYQFKDISSEFSINQEELTYDLLIEIAQKPELINDKKKMFEFMIDKVIELVEKEIKKEFKLTKAAMPLIKKDGNWIIER